MAKFTIGRVAREAGVGVETVRYYERRGLITRPAGGSGFREYDRGVPDRIRFIRRSQELGFTLSEVADLLRLTETPTATRGEVRTLAQQKVESVRERIRDLRRIEKTLAGLIEQCSGRGRVSGCPIVEAIAPPSKLGQDLETT